jgi:hypothetical protein
MLQCTGKTCVPPSGHYQSPANLAKLIRDSHKKYGPLPPKTVYTIPWECLCVDLICPCTLSSLNDMDGCDRPLFN